MKYISKLCLFGSLVLGSVAANAELYTFSYTFDASVRGTIGHTLAGVVDGTLLDDGDTIVINDVVFVSLAGLGYDITSDIGIRAVDSLDAPTMSLSGDKIDFWVCTQGFTTIFGSEAILGDCPFGAEGGFLVSSDSIVFGTGDAGTGRVHAGIPALGNSYRDSDQPFNNANWIAELAAVSRISFSYLFDGIPSGTAGHVLEGEVSGIVLDDEDTVLVLELREAFLDGIDYNVDKHGVGIRAVNFDEAPVISLSGDNLSLWVCTQGFTGTFGSETSLGDCPFGAEGGFLVSSDDIVFGGGDPGTGRAHAGIPELGNSYRDSDQPINLANWTAVVTKTFKPKKPKKEKNK
ncbi:MAG: hypothetical protein COB20_06705 [SAR86 cluster bacterium]|uniref:Uncharacterized protein n=1 Tax=SAR86 cluster bacterium TaxID=2030880 RepID=A0A2A4X755_9GAMM|nr:MAG: hypothetical protein COB20_06705 [SAR86 cluster bacterium]